MGLKKSIISFWKGFDDFEKHIFIGFLILLALVTLISNNLGAWISEVFSVPPIKGKGLGIDAVDIMLFFTVLLVIISWFIRKLFRLIFKKK